MVVVKKFCCCDLYTGTLISSIFFILISGTSCISYIIDLSSSNVNEMIIPMPSEEPPIVIRSYTSHYMIAATITELAVASLMLYGSVKQKRQFLLPWLILSAFGTIIIGVVLILGMFFSPILLLGWLVLAPYAYIWLCIFSYYQTLDPLNPDHITQIPTYTATETGGQPVMTYNQQPPTYNQCYEQPQVV